MEKTKQSTEVNLTAFEILQAVTGELPCYASPNWNVSDKKNAPPKKNPSAGLGKANGGKAQNENALGERDIMAHVRETNGELTV